MALVHDIPELHNPVQVTPSMIPSEKDVEFHHLPFFQKGNHLPSPEEVRAQAKSQSESGTNPDKRRAFDASGPHRRPPPALFESMNLFVKWGTSVRVAEGQCLFAINKLLKEAVPAPLVYGWHTDGEEVFLYMEMLSGNTLEKAWDILNEAERIELCQELQTIYNNLRQLEQDPTDLFIGTITRANLYDRSIGVNYRREAGPFSSVKSFHDWFVFLCRRRMSDPYSTPIEPFRQDLSDDFSIKFTHSDLHRSNILISHSKPHHVIGIVDWEQSGWFPEYWEYCKAHFTAFATEEWAVDYLPKILKGYENAYDAWNWYTMSMGC